LSASIVGSTSAFNNATLVGNWAHPDDTVTWPFDVNFANSQANTDYLVYSFIWPSGTVSNFDVKVMGFSNSTSGNTVTLTSALDCEASGVARGSGSLGTGSAASQVGVTSNQWFALAMTAVSTSGCSAGNMAFLKVTRSGTYTGSVGIPSLLIAITRTLP